MHVTHYSPALSWAIAYQKTVRNTRHSARVSITSCRKKPSSSHFLVVTQGKLRHPFEPQFCYLKMGIMYNTI